MAMTPESPDMGTYGIDTTVSGITIESCSETESPQAERVPDQKNAVANEKVYDTRVDLKLTYRGTKLTVTNGIVAFDGKSYAVDSHEKAGVYNGLQRYNLNAHRFDHFPSPGSGSPGSGSQGSGSQDSGSQDSGSQGS